MDNKLNATQLNFFIRYNEQNSNANFTQSNEQNKRHGRGKGKYDHDSSIVVFLYITEIIIMVAQNGLQLFCSSQKLLSCLDVRSC